MAVNRTVCFCFILVLASMLSACSGGGGGGGNANTDLKVNTTSVTFNAIVNGNDPAGQDYLVSWSRTDVAQVLFGYPAGTSIPTWLNINATGTVSPITLSLSVYTGSLPIGTYQTTVRIVSVAASGSILDIVDIPVTLNVADMVAASPASVDFSANVGEAPLINQKTVNLMQSGSVLTPTGVSVSPGASWLQAAISGNDVQISTTADALLLPAGIYQTDVIINEAFGNVTVPAKLTITQRSFSFVTPYIGTTNVAGNVIIRGSGFLAISAPSIKFGTYVATSSTVLSDSEIHAAYPAMPKGSYPITISGTGGDVVLNAKLEILDLPAFADTTLTRANNGIVTGLVYDAQRNNLYIADNTNGVVERYHYDGMSWNADQLSVPSVKGIALTPDGVELLAMSDDNVVHIDLDSFAVTASIPAPYVSINITASYTNLNHIAIANDGIASIMSEAPCCTGSSDYGYEYNILTRSFTDISYTLRSSDQDVAVTGDGSRVYAVGTVGSPPARVYYYNASSQTYVGSSLYQNSSSVVANRDGSRWISNLSAVYDSAFSLVGSLSITGTYTSKPVFNPSGNTVYLYSDSDGLLHKYDVTTANAGGGFDEIGTATSISAAPLGNAYTTAVMTVTPDGSKLFIASTNKIDIIASP